MDDLDLYMLMRQIVLSATGCPTVIMSNQNAPSPDGEYCAISTTSPKKQRGQAIIRESNTGLVTSPIGDVHDVDHSISAQVVADVTCNFYRGNASDYARKLFQCNKRPDIQELLFRANVGWNGAGATNNLTALQSEDWESRTQIVIRLTYEDTDTVTTNAIYQIPLVIEEFDSGAVIYDGATVLPNH